MKKKDYIYVSSMEYIGEMNEISVSKKIINKDYSLHWHDFFEIEIIIGGKGTQILNGQKYELKRGCVYMLLPTDFHEVKPDTEIELYNIMFHESMLSEKFLRIISEQTDNKIFYFGDDEFNKIVSMCHILQTEYIDNSTYKDEVLRNMLECFLIFILRKTAYSGGSRNESNHIQKALLYMQLHFKDNPSLLKTANVINLNPNYFSQKFKQTMGKTYIEYLTELKLAYAKKLLATSDLSVTEVCFASGFSSLSNFMRVFKEDTGNSPVAYSKK